MRAGFAQFSAFSQDAKDNKTFEQTKLTMPVLAVGGEKSFGSLPDIIMRHVVTNVQEAVVKGSGHWLMEERPAETVAKAENGSLRNGQLGDWYVRQMYEKPTIRPSVIGSPRTRRYFPQRA